MRAPALAALVVCVAVLPAVFAFSRVTQWDKVNSASENAMDGRSQFCGVFFETTWEVFVFGGKTVSGPSNDCWVFSVVSNGWQKMELTSVPPARFAHTGVLRHSDAMVIFGGEKNSGQYFADLWEYNRKNNQWTEIIPADNTEVPVPRKFHTASADSGVMFVCGGRWHNDRRNEGWMIDLTNTTAPVWQRLAVFDEENTPCNRVRAASVARKGKFYVHGGMNSDDHLLSDMWMYDMATAQWSEIIPLGSLAADARASHAAVLVGSKMFIHGGLGWGGSGQSSVLRTTRSFDTNDNRWRRLALVGTSPFLSDHVMAGHLTNLYLFGGVGLQSSTPSDASYSIETFARTADEILPAGMMPPGREGHIAIGSPEGNKVWIYGGWNGDEALDDIWMYNLDKQLWERVNVEIPVMPHRSAFAAAAVVPIGYRLIFGGHDSGKNPSNKMIVVNINDFNSWKVLRQEAGALVPPPMYQHGMVWMNDSAVVYGGRDGDQAFGDVWRFVLSLDPPASEISNAGDKMGDLRQHMHCFIDTAFNRQTASYTEATWEAWVTINTLYAARVEIARFALSCGIVTFGYDAGFFFVTGCSGGRNWAGAAYTLGAKWHHMAVTSKNDEAEIYIDGELISPARPVPGSPVLASPHTIEVEIGRDSNVEALFDELRFWSVAKTKAQIVARMYERLPPTTRPAIANLQTMWKFDFFSNTDGITLDGSGNLRDGHLGSGVDFMKPLFRPSTAPTGPDEPRLFNTHYLSGRWEKVMAYDEQNTARPQPTPRFAFATTSVYDRYIFVYGGLSMNNGTITQLSDLWQLDVAGKTWTPLSLSSLSPPKVAFHQIIMREEYKFWILTAIDSFNGMQHSHYRIGTQALTSYADITSFNLPPFKGFSAIQVKASGNRPESIVLFGGSLNDRYYSNAVYTVDSNSLKTWSLREAAVSNIPPAREKAGFVLLEGGSQVLLFGGYHEDLGFMNDMWIYSLVGGLWYRMVQGGIAGVPGPRSSFVFQRRGGDSVYAFGGDTATGPTNELWKFVMYSDRAGNWTLLKPTTAVEISPRFDVMGMFWGRIRLLVFGGDDGTKILDDSWAFDFDQMIWHKWDFVQKEPPSTPGVPGPPLARGCMVWRETHAYAFGGMTAKNDPSVNSNAIYELHVSSHLTAGHGYRLVPITPRNPKAPAPPGLYDHSCVFYNGWLFVSGGRNQQDQLNTETWAWNFDQRLWLKVSPVGAVTSTPPHRAAAGMILSDEFAYMHGGSDDSRYLDDLWRFNLELANPEQCVVSDVPITTIAMEENTFHISARNIFGNALKDGGVIFDASVQSEDGSSEFNILVEDNGDGSYTSTFAINGIGDFKLIIKLYGDDVQGSPFIISVRDGPAAPELSIASGDGLTGAVAGEPSEFLVQAKDVAGNPLLLGGEVTAILQLQGVGSSDPIVGHIEDNQDGSFGVDYLATVSGAFALNVLLNDVPINGSPWTLFVNPGRTDDSKTRVVPIGQDAFPIATKAGLQTTVRVETFDSFNNPKFLAGEDDVQMVFLGLNKTEDVTVNVLPRPNGVYLMKFFPFRSGNFQFNILINGAVVDGSPYDVIIDPVFQPRSNLNFVHMLVMVLPSAAYALGLIVCVVLGIRAARRQRGSDSPNVGATPAPKQPPPTQLPPAMKGKPVAGGGGGGGGGGATAATSAARTSAPPSRRHSGTNGATLVNGGASEAVSFNELLGDDSGLTPDELAVLQSSDDPRVRGLGDLFVAKAQSGTATDADKHRLVAALRSICGGVDPPTRTGNRDGAPMAYLQA